MKFHTYTGVEIREHRKKLGLNQNDFWRHFGTTQSGGSRYESSREIPEPIQILLNIALGTEAKSGKVIEGLRKLSGRHPQR